MNRIARFYIYGQWHIAICAAVLYMGGCLATSQPIHQATLLLVFFATMVIYNLHRFLNSRRMKNDARDRYDYMVRHPDITQSLLVTCTIFSVILFFYVPSGTQLILVLSGLISLGYILPLLFKKRLRDLGNAKIIFISIVWGLIPILSNIELEKVGINSWLFLEHFFFIFALTIPFDVRDQDLDRKAKVSNLANRLGISKLKGLMFFSILAAIAFAGLLYFNKTYSLSLMVCIGLFYLILIISTINLTRTKPEWYYLFYLDGLIAVKGSIYFLSI